MVAEEVSCLQRLDHPNIVRYHETYNDVKYVYIVMEYVTGIDLYDKITKQPAQKLSEAQAAYYTKSLCEALNHCHALNIVHGDIKPENIMVNDHDMLRLIDFGLAKSNSTSTGKYVGVQGTPYYMAPEAVNGIITKQVDIWSVGVILYIMVSGLPPFDGDTPDQIFAKIKAVDYNLNTRQFNSVSPECKDLIRKLLVHDPKKRLTISQTLQHDWIKKYSASAAKQR